MTPQADLTLNRTYNNGFGTSTGTGSTQATSWAEYGRFGIISDVSHEDRLTGFGELGQQYMSFAGYSETSSSANPFPASVNSGTLSMDVTRAGGSWTHKFDDIQLDADHNLPVSITLAGAIAHSFDVHSGLTATVASLGTSTAANVTDTWGEFGGRIEGQVTSNLAFDVDINGTTGGGDMGTAVHGGVGMSYKF